MDRLPNYGCLLADGAKQEDRLRDLELFVRYVAKIERNRCELEAWRIRDILFDRSLLDDLVQKIRTGSEFEDIKI